METYTSAQSAPSGPKGPHHLPSPRADAVLHPDQPFCIPPFCKAISSHPDKCYSFFQSCLQGQEPALTSELTWRWHCETGDAQEKPPAPAVVYLPPQNQLSPAANHHKTISIHVQTPTVKRNPVSLTHPSQRDVSVRAGMSCWLDLPLYLPSLQSQHNQLQSHFQPAPIKLEQISSANSDRR